MARYLAVLAVQAEGQRISLPAIDGANDDPLPDLPKIPEGRRLVAVVNNGDWQSALDVTFPTVYQRLHRRYRDGTWKAMDLYLIDEHRAAQIEDGRRVLMNGQPVQDPGRA
jgi:hypothetical protein